MIALSILRVLGLMLLGTCLAEGIAAHSGGFIVAAQFPPKIGIQPSATEVIVFKGDGRLHLAYELTVSNLNLVGIRINTIRIVGVRGDREIFTQAYTGDALRAIFSTIAGNYGTPQDPLLPPGGNVFLFLFLDFQHANSVPALLEASLEVIPENGSAPAQTIRSESVKVGNSNPIKLDPPLRGKGWWTPNGPSNFSIHRRTTVAIDGQVWRPERFAVDWVQIGPNGATFAGDPAQNASYFAYGKELLAVLDGRVVSTLDGIPENVPNGPPAVTLEPGNLPGNSIVLQFDEDHFALYAHLIPGTLRVRPGDRVRRGEVLGLLGNSGGSTQPHLHFQVMDRPIPLAADGLPFVFDHFWRRDYRIDCDNPNQNCDPADGPTHLILGRPHYVTDETFMNDDLGDFTER